MGRRLKVRDFGTSLLYSAATHKVDCGVDFVGVGDVTVVGWIKPSNIAGKYVDNGKFLFRTLSGTTIRLSSDGGTTHANAGSNALKLNQWNFIAATRTAAGVTNLYINGVLSGTPDQSSGTPAAATTNLIIGNRAAGSDEFRGNLDAFRFFNRILTAIEIANLYYDGQLPTVAADVNTNLIAEYLFNEGGGTTATDSGPYARNGTITGAAYSMEVPMRSRIKVRDFGGFSLEFANITDTLDCGSDFVGTGNVTIATWMKATALVGSQGRFLSNGKLIFRLSSSGLLLQSDGSTSSLIQNLFQINKWYFVAATRTSAGVVNFYVNGTAIGTPNQSSGTPAAATTNLFVGSDSSASVRFPGKLDNFRIFSKILSAGEIQALWREGRLPSVAADVNTSLAAEYLFNEGSGTTATDSSGWANTGTITGATYSSDVVTKLRTLAGNRQKVRDFGTALSFAGSGSSNFIDSIARDVNRFSATTNNFSCAFWINTTALQASSTTRILDKAGNDLIRIRLDTTNRIIFTIDPNAGSPAFSDLQVLVGDYLKLGKWYHIACVYEVGVGMGIYINGVLVRSNSTTFTGTTGDAAAVKWTVGGDSSGLQVLSGILDTIRIWRVSITAAEIFGLYYFGSVPKRSNLILEYLFNEGSGTTATDSSGWANTGTISGATYTTKVPIIPRTIV